MICRCDSSLPIQPAPPYSGAACWGSAHPVCSGTSTPTTGAAWPRCPPMMPTAVAHDANVGAGSPGQAGADSWNATPTSASALAAAAALERRAAREGTVLRAPRPSHRVMQSQRSYGRASSGQSRASLSRVSAALAGVRRIRCSFVPQGCRCVATGRAAHRKSWAAAALFL